MMAGEERRPLLFDDNLAEDDAYSNSRKVVNQLYRNQGGYSNEYISGINVSASSSVADFVESDNIIAIFVVCFDTKAGNIVEWSAPADMKLEGIEFKAMPSGAHTLVKDFVYFKFNAYYGLACYETMAVDNVEERGARMKSVGILAASYTLLYRHMHFLEKQVKMQLNNPGNYEQLQLFWEDKKLTLESTDSVTNLKQLMRNSSPLVRPARELLSEFRITHPAGCFSQFLQFFGERIFTLWKFMLLRKRLLFFSPPPIGVVCYRVYCCCCLGSHRLPQFLGTEPKPHFFVNINDIDTLEAEACYIACTTEKIFETKPQLYDVYVDNQNLKTDVPVLKDLLKINSADRDKFVKLTDLRTSQLYAHSNDALSEEQLFVTYFTELNNRLFQTLFDISFTQDKQLSNEHMKSMGLDPQGDRTFLMELVEMHGIDVVLMVDNPCCPK